MLYVYVLCFKGSGLGTSSILAATVLAAIWRCMGVEYTNTDIIHSVLVVEQLLSTGFNFK